MTAPVLQLPVKVLRSATAGRRPGDGSVRALTDGELFVNTQDRVLCYLSASGGLLTVPFDPAFFAALASLASPAFTGTPSAPTPVAGDNSTSLATTAFVAAAVTALVAGSPAALDTLKELADALGDDPNYAATTAAALGNRLRLDAAQGATPAQRLLGRQNLGAIGAGALTKTAAYQMTAADAGKLFLFGAATAITLPAISAVGDGFVVEVGSPRAAGVVGTLGAAGSDAIDASLASLRVAPGSYFFVLSDGTQWRTFGRSSRITLQKTTLTSGSSLILPLPPGYDEFELATSFTTTGAAQLGFVLSFDGGQSYVTATNSYQQQGVYQSGTTASAFSTGGTFAQLSAAGTSAAYYGARSRLRFCPGVPSAFVSTWDCAMVQNGSGVGSQFQGGYNFNTNRPTHMSVLCTSGTFAYLDAALYGIVTQ